MKLHGAEWNALRKMLRYLRGSKMAMWWTMVCSICSVILTLNVPILVGDTLDFMIEAGNVDFPSIFKVLVTIAVCVAVNALMQWFISIIGNRIAFQTVQHIRDDAMQKIQSLPVSYLDGHSTGETVSRMIADADAVADGLLMGFTQLFTGICTIVGTLAFMLRIHITITIVVVILTPLSLFAAKYIASKTYTMFHAQSDARARQTAFLNEMIQNQRIVKTFGHEKQTLSKFDELNGTLGECSLKATFFSSLTNPVTRFVNAVVYAAVGFTGAVAAVHGNITIGGLSTFLSYANQYTKPFNEISGVITELQNALACADRIFKLLEQPVCEPDVPNASVLTNPKGNVTFSDVSFSYTTERPFIQHCNFNIKSGQHIAIVGPTGCGKTTLINLLMRFYDVTDGTLCIDGTDIRAITRESLRRNIGMVLQDTWLCSGTIRDNISMGKPDATEEEVIAAAKSAHAHSFIRRLPQGYDTVISDKSGALSQGQRQLLCIARLMLALPPMLILDEATSSIDTRTELKIQSAFQKMMQGRTSLIVAHRLSTVQEADWILVMKDGNIIEQGTHETLLSQNGFYAVLYHSQFAP